MQLGASKGLLRLHTFIQFRVNRSSRSLSMDREAGQTLNLFCYSQNFKKDKFSPSFSESAKESSSWAKYLGFFKCEGSSFKILGCLVQKKGFLDRNCQRKVPSSNECGLRTTINLTLMFTYKHDNSETFVFATNIKSR